MKSPRVRRPLGAEPRLEPSPFGTGALRREWVAKIDAFTNLGDALAELLAFRETSGRNHLTDVDALWIEARLEERVAVLRFAAHSFDEIRYQTLTGENIADVRRRYETAATTDDPSVLENLAGEFRRRYKPPVMPTTDFMRLEVILSERLMKRRSLSWFDTPIESLRARRGAAVVKDGSSSGGGRQRTNSLTLPLRACADISPDDDGQTRPREERPWNSCAATETTSDAHCRLDKKRGLDGLGLLDYTGTDVVYARASRIVMSVS